MSEKLSLGEGRENKPNFQVEEILPNFSEQELREFHEVEKSAFPEQMQEDIEDLEKMLKNPDGVHLALKDGNEKIIGYISGIRHSHEYDYLKERDPNLKNDENAIYVGSIGINPGERGLEKFNALWKTFMEKSKEKGYKKITMHARATHKKRETGFSNVLQKKYGAKFLRRIENWFDFEEPFDYLEINLSDKE